MWHEMSMKSYRKAMKAKHVGKTGGMRKPEMAIWQYCEN